eukprot:s399_g2.t5
MPSKGERLRRRARELRAWLELGDASLEEAEEIFTDVQLRSRLSDPLGFYEAAALGGEPLPAEAAALATKAASHLGVSQAVSEDLLRLLAEDRLSGSPVLHAAGIFEVLELNTPGAGVFAELAGLLHAEQCEALQALAAILRGAHDDGHAFGAQCRELAQKLLSEGLEKTLWDSYTKVSGCPRFSPGSEHGEVERVVKEGLSLQLCVLECLEFFRQRFLGSLPKAAHQHHWLLGDSEICFRAQCVGDLCLTLLLEAFCLEEVAAQPEQAVARHVFLASSVHMKHLQQLIEGSWLDICHHAAHPKEATPALVHCGRCVALVALGWAVLVGSVPESYRETHGLGFQRLTSSAVFQSRHLLSDAAGSLQATCRFIGGRLSHMHGYRTVWLTRFCCCGSLDSHSAKMLQLRMLSGEAVPGIPVEEIQDVKALKQRLAQLHTLPPRFRQRVLFHGENLKDDAGELAAAAMQGSISEVESSMQLPQDSDLIGDL